MQLGASYYPELIDESQWAADLDRAVAHGIKSLRVFEFAWSSFEPREGEYAWGWADRFVDLCERKGLQLVICTPTATPPPWFTRQYPDALVELRSGLRRDVGSRRDLDLDHPVYQQFSEDICVALVQRWGRRAHVLAWQLDNELCGPEYAPNESHSPAANAGFRRFLKHKHGTVAALNRAWGTAFWSQSYSDWGEVGTPRNPRCTHGHALDHVRYVSESTARFTERCLRAMRPHTDHPIGHNHTAVLDRGIDHQRIAETHDVTGWDAYPGAAGGCAGDFWYASSALAHDWFRTMKHKPFIVWEMPPGGARMSLAYLAEMHARGASWALFWLWRTHRANVEQASTACAGFDGTVRAESAALMAAFASRTDLHETLPATLPRRQAALIFPIDNVRVEMRDYQRDEPRPPARSLRAFIHTYHALWRAGIAVDILLPGQDLSGYTLVALPAPRLLSDADATIVVDAVRAGATLFACGACALLDEFGVYRERPGAPLAELLGFTVPEHHPRADGPWTVAGDGWQGECLGGAVEIPSGEHTVLASFTSGPLSGRVAAIERLKGRVVYAAGAGSSLCHPLLRRAAATAGIVSLDNPHDDVGSCPDLQGRGRWFFNYSTESRTVDGVTIAARDYVWRQ